MIYFLRHQETVNNQLGMISGQSDSLIRKQSFYADNSKIVKNIDVVYSSPAQRCIDTLNGIQDLLVSPIIDKRLLERNMGDFENCLRKEVYAQYPNLFWNIHGKIQFRFEFTPPNGESFSEFFERIFSFCEEEIFSNKECNILICSHNQALKMIYFILKGVHPSEENWRNLSFPNGKCVPYIF